MNTDIKCFQNKSNILNRNNHKCNTEKYLCDCQKFSTAAKAIQNCMNVICLISYLYHSIDLYECGKIFFFKIMNLFYLPDLFSKIDLHSWFWKYVFVNQLNYATLYVATTE